MAEETTSETSSKPSSSSSLLTRFAAIAVIALLVGAAVGYLVASSQLSPQLKGLQDQVSTLQTQANNLTSTVNALKAKYETVKEYTIGGALGLSGDLAPIGQVLKEVVTWAVKDLNQQLADQGIKIKFNTVIADTKTNPTEALKAVQTLAAAGVRVIVGPLASSEIAAVKAYADENKIVIVSPSSTAASLAIPGDFIFRDVFSDVAQAAALASLAKSLKLTKVVVFHRDDPYGIGLAQFFKKDFEALGGKVTTLKYATGLADYASDVAALSSTVKSFGADAVLSVTFDTDGVNILTHAKDDATLRTITLLTSEGIHGTPQLKEPAIAAYLQLVKYIGTRPTPAANPLADTLLEAFKQRMKTETGRDYTVFSEYIYDAVFLVGRAIVAAGKYDGAAIAQWLPKVGANYFGLTGWCIFDENGDRPSQGYAIWTIAPTDGAYDFKDVGSYVAGTLTWG